MGLLSVTGLPDVLAPTAQGFRHHCQVCYVGQRGPPEWFCAPQHTSPCAPTWLEDAGPIGASDEMDGEEQEGRVLNNSRPEDCQEEMHFP